LIYDFFAKALFFVSRDHKTKSLKYLRRGIPYNRFELAPPNIFSKRPLRAAYYFILF